MITKTALIAALTLGTVSVASASEFDANLRNRYPQAGVADVHEPQRRAHRPQRRRQRNESVHRPRRR